MKFNEMHRRLAAIFAGMAVILFFALLVFPDAITPALIGNALFALAAAMLVLGYEGKN